MHAPTARENLLFSTLSKKAFLPFCFSFYFLSVALSLLYRTWSELLGQGPLPEFARLALLLRSDNLTIFTLLLVLSLSYKSWSELLRQGPLPVFARCALLQRSDFFLSISNSRPVISMATSSQVSSIGLPIAAPDPIVE